MLKRKDLIQLRRVKQARFDRTQRELVTAQETLQQAKDLHTEQQEALELREQEVQSATEDLHNNHFFRFNTRDEFDAFQLQLDQWSEEMLQLQNQLEEQAQKVTAGEEKVLQCLEKRRIALQQVVKFSTLWDQEQKRSYKQAEAKEEQQIEENNELKYR